jgi:uncharacterized protein YqjF (DUF2071 family)
MTDEDRLAPSRRPAGRSQGFQRWDGLLFLHWQVPEVVLRPLVDRRLELDDLDGHLYVGLVSFTMAGVRPFLPLPAFPTAARFGEINLRTYVHRGGREPGVYFFSLDAASSLVVLGARAGWGLPYYRAHVGLEADGPRRGWRSARRWPHGPARHAVRCSVGARLPPPPVGSLPFFLTERYQFYAPRGDALLRARVHHAPYVLHEARDVEVETELLAAAGLPATGARTPDWYSPGVDVDVYAVEEA